LEKVTLILLANSEGPWRPMSSTREMSRGRRSRPPSSSGSAAREGDDSDVATWPPMWQVET